jgi:hypothetical protein
MNVMRAHMAFAMRAPAFAAPAAPPWTPLDLGASLKGFWNADDHGTANMTDDGAGLISSWKDRVSALNCTGAAALRPTWAATSFNSVYPGVTFGGTQYLVAATVGSLPAGATAGEIWFSAHNKTAAGGSNMFAFSYGGNATLMRAIFRNSTNRAVLHDAAASTANTAALWDAASFMGGFWAGTTQDGRQNGSPWSAPGTITSLNTGTAGVAIGARKNATPDAPFGGTLRHILVTLTLTALQRQQMEGWLAWDAGMSALLPVGHPYKSARP